MGQLIKLTGIVLSASNVGEYDKRVVILTKERGKITAFARGARKMGSPFLAACQSFAYGSFTVFSGKNYNINAVEMEEYFPELKEDMKKLYLGLYFCEMADYFTIEGNDELSMMQLLYITLSALRKGVVENELIRVIYEIKLLAYFGLMMETSCCANCSQIKSEKEGGNPFLTHFCSAKGGVVCTNCAKRLPDAFPILESTLFTLQYILSQPVTKLYHFRVTTEVLRELKRVSTDYQRVHVNHVFKTLEFLDFMEIPNSGGDESLR